MEKYSYKQFFYVGLIFIWVVTIGCTSVHQLSQVKTAELRIRVVDHETGQLMPAKLVIECENKTYAKSPYQNHAVFIDGQGDFILPLGTVKIFVSRGFEYQPQQVIVRLSPQRRNVLVRLKRLVNLPQIKWYCGDSHIHVARRENARIATNIQYGAMLARAVGLDYVTFVQLYDSVKNLTNDQIFTICNENSDTDFICRPGVEMKGYNDKIPKIHYLRLNLPNLIGQEGWHLIEQSEEERTNKHNPVFIAAHPTRWWLDNRKNAVLSNLARELPLAVVCGAVDAIEILENERDLQTWFAILNAGYRVAGVMNSDTGLDTETGGDIGWGRTYTYSEKFDYNQIMQNLKQGKNFATTGPLLLFSIDTFLPGTILEPDAQQHSMRILCYTAGYGDELKKLKIIRNGMVINTVYIPERKKEFQYEYLINETEKAWYLVQLDSSSGVAIANPIYFLPKQEKTVDIITSVKVTGVVTDVHGNPIPAVVKLVSPGTGLLNTGIIYDTITSDNSGKFSFETNPGRKIQVTSQGYYSLVTSIVFASSKIQRFVESIDDISLTKRETYIHAKKLMNELDIQIWLKPLQPVQEIYSNDSIVLRATSGSGWLVDSSGSYFPAEAVKWNPKDELCNEYSHKKHQFVINIPITGKYYVWLRIRKAGEYFISTNHGEETVIKPDWVPEEIGWFTGGSLLLNKGENILAVSAKDMRVWHTFDAVILTRNEDFRPE
ncbi:MAG: CehA/McbA family metallohydrolase [bacterium]|nr:CehA/McbA family metallohydrolase [bacterium]